MNARLVGVAFCGHLGLGGVFGRVVAVVGVVGVVVMVAG